MPPPPLRIAILQCDSPFGNFGAKYQCYGNVFKQMLHRAADELSVEGLSSKSGLELTYFQVTDVDIEYPNLEDFDAILMTGSRYDAFADEPWINRLTEFTRCVLEEQERVRVIGVCFGHQIVGRAMGARVGRGDKGWEISVVPVELSGKGRELFKVDKLSIWQMHKDIVFDFPPGTEQLASTAICENQGMYTPKKLITVQGHPEYTREIEEEVIKLRYANGIFPDDVYKDAMRRIVDHDDGIIVGQAFLRFLLE